MKRVFFLSICLMMLFVTEASADSLRKVRKQYNDSITALRDSLQKHDPDVLKMKAIGRYDRGIINYRFIPKGHKIFGITAAYSNYTSENSQMLLILNNLDYQLKTLRVNPFAGYFFRDNQMVGVKFGYNNLSTRIDDSSLDIDGLDFSLSNIVLTEKVYSSALFHRSYVGLDRGRRFGLFNETSLSLTTGDATFSRLENGEQKLTETAITQLELGISPGVAVFIMQNVSAELSFGLVGFNYRKETQTVNNVDAGSFSSSGADFKISLLNINIGITVCL